MGTLVVASFIDHCEMEHKFTWKNTILCESVSEEKINPITKGVFYFPFFYNSV